jgi:ABC-type bacteriocin/lantibiotic exporter with double-glycine peptidase domain
MISKLAEGIQTKVGNDGILLSGGERQRIALARAIYKNPNIYFLDESTSALDEQTEEEIMNNIKKNFKNKTIILISHRASSLEKCDKVLTLDNGMIY